MAELIAGAASPDPAGWRRRLLSGELRTHAEIHEAVFLFSGDVVAKQSRFWLLLVLSAVIATGGVVGDSTATVIGAMIIAPLATPIQGIAAGLAGGESRQLGLSTALVLAAGLAVVLLAALMAVILPELHAPADNSQITARVSPTIVDLAVAAATGLAGAFAVARRDIGDILPGVAIAISLVPPLAVVGVTAVEGDWHGALGALLLFATNVLAMVVVGALVFGTVAGLRGETRSRRAYWVIGVTGTIVVAGLAAATAQTVRLSTWRDAGSRVAAGWAREHGERLVRTRFEGNQLVFVVEGHAGGEDDGELAERLRGEVPSGTEVVVNRVGGDRHDVGVVP
jgi:uncharacterized hydrophobic protein (TIGR00271 family)